MKTKKLIVRTKQRVDTWHLAPELVELVTPIAREIEMSLCEFLTRWSYGQVHTNHARPEVPPDFKVILPRDKTIRQRISRVAAIDGKSIRSVIWDAIIGDVIATEEYYIFKRDGSIAAEISAIDRFRTVAFPDGRD